LKKSKNNQASNALVYLPEPLLHTVKREMFYSWKNLL